MDRAFSGVAVPKVSMLRLLGLAVLFTGCVSGGHLAGGKLYETKATARTAWRALQGSWPSPPKHTQGLAIALRSKWGAVAQLWGDGRPHSHVVRTGEAGPYGLVTADGTPYQFGDVQAVVVDLEFASQPEASSGFVVQPTKVRVVPSAKAERAIDDAVARWKQHLAAEQGAIDRALDAANRASDGRPLSLETTATQDGFIPTWMPEDQRFVVVFARTIRRTSQISEEQRTAPCGKYRNMFPGPGFPDDRPVRVSCPQMPPTITITHTRSYAVDVALVLEYDADGTRTFERWYEPDPTLAKGPF